MTFERDKPSRIGGMTVMDRGAGRLIFLDKQGAEETATSISEQMHVVLALVERRLTDAGALPWHILSVRIDLADPSGYQHTMRAWTARAGVGRVVARPTVGFLEEPRGALVAMTIVAAFKPDRPSKR